MRCHQAHGCSTNNYSGRPAYWASHSKANTATNFSANDPPCDTGSHCTITQFAIRIHGSATYGINLVYC